MWQVSCDLRSREPSLWILAVRNGEEWIGAELDWWRRTPGCPNGGKVRRDARR